MNKLFELNIEKFYEIINCLDDLFINEKIITGYNSYFEIPNTNELSLCLSNIYSGSEYLKCMVKDLNKLGYSHNYINKCIRSKKGVYEWKSDWNIWKDGKLQSDLKIRKFGNKDFINLKNLNKNIISLSDIYGINEKFIAEDESSEINISVKQEDSMFELVDLFSKKSSKFLYDEKGKTIGFNKFCWEEAWDVPVLLIGGNIMSYEFLFPEFIKSVRFFKYENENEISFIIHKKFDKLKNSDYFDKLIKFGFQYEFCLANKPFILQYVDI